MAAPRQSRRVTVHVEHVKAISRDVLHGTHSSESDTQAEPSVAVDPEHPHRVVAVFQEGRFPSGGAVAIGYATSHDEGRTWVRGELPGLTTAVGGHFKRASDPVVAFGAGGTVYAESLLANPSSKPCRFGMGRNAVAVSRSDDGGLTFGAPVIVQQDSGKCKADSNDKPWIAVDSYPASPHFGRVYVVWTRTLRDRFRWVPFRLKVAYSDDDGRTWTKGLVSRSFAFGGIPLVQPNGNLTVLWDDIDSLFTISLRAATSHNGGQTFGSPTHVGRVRAAFIPKLRNGPPGGFPSATVDPVTGNLYAVWEDTRYRPRRKYGPAKGSDILISRSSDGGQSWSSPRRANHDRFRDNLDHFLPAIAAYAGDVHVSYMTRHRFSKFIRERYIFSRNEGRRFGAEHKLGHLGDLTHAARVCQDCGTKYAKSFKFIGDYMALGAARSVAYAVWIRPATPRSGSGAKHQRTWSATISLTGS
jgi:hypothetical protein